MFLALIFSHLWGVVELAALAQFTRTIRLRTILASLAAGFYGCSLLAIAFQFGWTRAAAGLTGATLNSIVALDSYTLGPLSEEILKLLPLILILGLFPGLRRQWTLTDCVLIGAATGSGFGLAEHVFALSGLVSRAFPVSGGWVVPIGLFGSTVSSVTASLFSWLPAGLQNEFLRQPGGGYNLHLEWSALGGLAAGLVFLRGATNPRRVAAAIFVYVVGDHAAFNYTVLGAHGIGTAVAGAFNSLRNLLSVMPVAALIVAWRLDCRQSCTGSARDILALRHQIERFTATVRKVEFRQTEFIGRLVADWLRQPTNAMVLLLILPSLLWVGLGGFPQMAWVQSLLATKAAWIAVRLLAVVGLVWMGWQLANGIASWRQAETGAAADAAAMPTLRLFSGSGAFLSGAFSLLAGMAGLPASAHVLRNFHVLQAAEGATLLGSLATSIAVLPFIQQTKEALSAGGALAFRSLWQESGAATVANDATEQVQGSAKTAFTNTAGRLSDALGLADFASDAKVLGPISSKVGILGIASTALDSVHEVLSHPIDAENILADTASLEAKLAAGGVVPPLVLVPGAMDAAGEVGRSLVEDAAEELPKDWKAIQDLAALASGTPAGTPVPKNK
jgi:hypothetical protein